MPGLHVGVGCTGVQHAAGSDGGGIVCSTGIADGAAPEQRVPSLKDPPVHLQLLRDSPFHNPQRRDRLALPPERQHRCCAATGESQRCGFLAYLSQVSTGANIIGFS